MVRYILQRLVQGVLVVMGAFTLAFLILNIIPGNPVALMLSQGGQESDVPVSQIRKVSAEFGYNKPIIVQYLTGLGHLFQGNLGRSVQTGQPVLHEIVQALPPTLQLAAGAIVIGVVVGSAIGFFGTYFRRHAFREATLTLPSIGASMPSFWVGLMLLFAFSFRLRWFPAFGNQGFKSLVLPAITLGISTGAVIGQVFARSMVETLRQPYVNTAHAKGLSKLRIHVMHVARNAVMPAITVAGLVSGRLIAGAVIIETVFGRNGIGSLTVNAVESKDLAVVQGVVVLTAVVFVIVNLLVDLMYPLLDPRIELGIRRRRAR